MEQNREKKFVCKYCNKRYPCGKSLGGHMRTHMNNENRAEAEGRAEISSINKFLSTSNATYDLRGNPKKSKRFSDESGNGTLLREMMICKECGKGFQSLKALCGHMVCHSEKERVFQRFEDHCDDQSDTEKSASRMRRSKRTRLKNCTCSISIPNGSSSVSGIEDQQEQEEVAVCLMMLSRDSSGCNKGLNSVAYSSDNNSVVLEAKSSVKKQRETKLKSTETGPKKMKSRIGAEDVSKFKCSSNGKAEKKLGSKRKKGHECPFCFRVFKSGQALGGHKRSHFVGDPEDTTLLIKQDSPEMPLPPLIDLNLPAPGEEDAIYSV
ncbi:putative WRKY transcription factor 57-like isoform X1 [Hibiscus syriacus]|uniref:WRKY transcription factor 57-like isoform X1 n=1 Tax=Hibiscus syriacus TaxID=106335 RepID=A0A6A3D0S8_HIBSY|nr:zinc finger protein ZAT4-like [Hibiscus syriacus]KAE8732919.1 putative WRKY transcription factor 57-like isoform X1 [Hibiscus syriacus]